MIMASAAQVKKFIEQIAPLIQKYAKANGYKIASTVIAQACCESAYGTCALSPYHNYFGLKCGSAWKGKSVNMKTKEEYTVGTLTTIKDNFRVYDSMEEGVAGYYGFISAKRYSGGIAGGNLHDATTYRQYAEMLKLDGYATSSTYVSTLCSIVEKHNLTQYDDFSGTMSVQSTTTAQEQEVLNAPTKVYFKVGKNYTLQYGMWVRDGANGNKKPWSKLTVSGKSHSVRQSDGTAVMKKGTVVTCQEIKTVGSATWIRIPSGWICGIGSDGTQYVK